MYCQWRQREQKLYKECNGYVERERHFITGKVKCLIKGGLLSEFEKREIENEVEKDLNNKHGDKETDFDIECDNGVAESDVEMGEEVESPERIEVTKEYHW